MRHAIVTTTRRRLFEMLAAGSGLAALGLPERVLAQSRNSTLVIGLDLSDSITLDPATSATGPYTPIATKFPYDSLLTLAPGDLVTLRPSLATAWERTPDGSGWRMTIREGVKFASGNVMTVEDVKWSLDRVINIKAQPSLYIANLASTRIVDDRHVDLILKDPRRPVLSILCHTSFPVYERKVLETHGGDASADANTRDKAGEWLNQHSCGTGPYTQLRWDRGTGVFYERNPHYWRGMPAFERLVIRHLADPSAQLLAVQRGDIDVAFNLIPEQVESLKQSKTVRIQPMQSLDMIYVALTANPEFNKALAVREAREAVMWAIDREGMKNNLLNGLAQLPATVLPIGLLGSTTDISKQIGFHEDLPRAKALLAKAGFPDGFSFKLSYGNANYAAISYAVLAQKMQADLARVGIKAELDPQDAVTLRTQYNTGKSTAVIQAFPPSGIDNWIWAMATVTRLPVRMHWPVPPDMVKLVDDANTEPDQNKQQDLWLQYQKRMVDEAYLWPLFQMDYQFAVSDRLKPIPFNAAGWYFDGFDVRPV